MKGNRLFERMVRWFKKGNNPEAGKPRLRKETRPRLRLEYLEDRLAPAAYVVNALTDTGTGSGLNGDLLYCVGHAQDGDTITFASGLSGSTITVGSTLALTQTSQSQA